MGNKGSDIQEMARAGIPVRHDRNAAHMHHKYSIVDQRTVLNGSFNYTRQAVLGNQENVVISSNPALVNAFAQQFEKLWAQFAQNRA